MQRCGRHGAGGTARIVALDVAQGHEVIPPDVRTIPAEALLGADFRHPAIVEATELFDRADGVVIGPPVCKAAYSGLLKSLTVAPGPAEALAQVVDQFSEALGSRTALLRAAG